MSYFRAKLVAGLTLLVLNLGQRGLAEAVKNQLSEAERRTGWELLFDGKSAAAWRKGRALQRRPPSAACAKEAEEVEEEEVEEDFFFFFRPFFFPLSLSLREL